MAESWAEHVARVMCDRQYGANSQPFRENGSDYLNGTVPGLTSHLSYLELFSPNDLNNPFRWIPEGIYLDLIDTMNENAPVQDRISNYTNRQLFDALDNDVRSMPEFRDRFLQENGLNSNVIDLFTQYHY